MDSMINEAQALKGKLREGAQGAADPFNNIFDGLDSTASKDATGSSSLSVLNKASVLHHQAFLIIREEHEAEVRELTEKGDTYRLLIEKLRADLEATQSPAEARTYWALKTQIDAIQAKAEEFKKNMDILALKKETVQAQLESAEAQLQAAKEKASVQENLANEIEVVRSEMVVANIKVDAKLAQFKVEAEAIRAQAKSMVDHAKLQALREAFEGVHSQGFDILAEIKNAKA
ncbi:uncharacterized protein [Nicotiana tomentosiformis]|uniref:uncharacterized protein n=1 Tax=Nicotiana tomentosiformis TaxID=4098 RepID=UPI00388C3AEF